ncbi:MAG: GSU2403 family nucleotidyltransferase fold protein, partial [Xanthobacteraceae bacterium]
PCRIVATDPRVWAAHKLWFSQRQDRERIERRRDEFQARTVARLVAEYMPHLPYDSAQLKMLPKPVFDQAAPLFHR